MSAANPAAATASAYGVDTLRTDMNKRLQSLARLVIRRAIQEAKKSTSLAELSYAVRMQMIASTKSAWHCIVGRDFVNNIRYRKRHFYYGKCVPGKSAAGVHSPHTSLIGLEFCLFRSGPPKLNVATPAPTFDASDGADPLQASKGGLTVDNGPEVDGEMFEKNKVVVCRSQFPKAVNRTISDLVRLGASQKMAPEQGKTDMHMGIATFVKARLEVLYDDSASVWHVFVGDAQALDGSVVADDNYVGVYRVGPYKAIVFRHADREVDPACTPERVTRVIYSTGILLFLAYLYCQHQLNETCLPAAALDNECTPEEIEIATWWKEVSQYLTMVLTFTLIVGASMKMYKKVRGLE